MSSGHQHIKWCRNIAKNFNRMSRVHERYRQTDGWTDDDMNMNMSSRSLKRRCCCQISPVSTFCLLGLPTNCKFEEIVLLVFEKKAKVNVKAMAEH